MKGTRKTLKQPHQVEFKNWSQKITYIDGSECLDMHICTKNVWFLKTFTASIPNITHHFGAYITANKTASIDQSSICAVFKTLRDILLIVRFKHLGVYNNLNLPPPPATQIKVYRDSRQKKCNNPCHDCCWVGGQSGSGSPNHLTR